MLFAPETFNLGETSRGIEVAREVRALGHEVRFMGYSRRFATDVREAGFALELLHPELSDDEADRLIAADQGRILRHPFTTDMVRRRVTSELALFDRWRPDCVVIGTTLTVFISARTAAIPLVYVRPYAMSRGHLATMTAFPVTHGHTPVGRQANRIAGGLVRAAAPRVRWKPASFRRVAAEHGVRLAPRTVDALDADLNLIASLFPFLDGRTTCPGEIAVGPIFARSGGKLPASVTALAQSPRSLVHVGLGSSANRRLALDVLTQVGELDVDVVTSAGRYLHDGDRTRLPANIHVHDFLPAHRLAGLVDASVIHGGEGTVQTACASGAPFAGIGLQAEQRFNIDECVRHGNATRFTPRDIARHRLPTIVSALLTDAGMRRVARDLKGRAEAVGAANAAREIVRHLSLAAPH